VKKGLIDDGSNITWVSYPIESNQPSDEELFGDVMNE